MEPVIISAQIKAVTEDFTVKAIKTGMLFSAEIIRAVADSIWDSGIPLVVDPVVIAKGGASLLQDEAVEALKVCPLAVR